MNYDEFVQEERNKRGDEFYELDADHSYHLTYGDATSFEDKGWPHKISDDGRDLVVSGAIVNHRLPNGDTCGGYITFAKPRNPSPHEAAAPLWTVEQIDPLTIDPSVWCHCKQPGSHGLIKNGKWIPAG